MFFSLQIGVFLIRVKTLNRSDTIDCIWRVVSREYLQQFIRNTDLPSHDQRVWYAKTHRYRPWITDGFRFVQLQVVELKGEEAVSSIAFSTMN